MILHAHTIYGLSELLLFIVLLCQGVERAARCTAQHSREEHTRSRMRLRDTAPIPNTFSIGSEDRFIGSGSRVGVELRRNAAGERESASKR